MRSRFLTLLLITFFLSGCSASNDLVQSKQKSVNSFESIDELRQAFVNAGGQCWGWKEASDPEQLKDKIGQGDCDDNTVLILYKDYVNVEEQSIDMRTFLLSLNYEVSILFGENWYISGDQIQTVYPKMGGTLMTR